ncbi:MAG TPA: amidohydrolase family protein, partial [Candidatus Binatia bacterium]|nr:amidohydrolase family protein [Candidatus Binatia bacterium]
MQPIIDADTHIAESEAMWQMIDEKMYPRRPVLLSLPDDTLYGGWNATWLIDGNIFPKPVGKGGFRLVTPSASKIQSNRRDIQVGCRELTDVAARLTDMDRGGIAAQVVYPTLFLIYLTDDAELDVALSRAYNRFMAHACAQSHGRIHWVAIPLRCDEESVKELKWAKQNGAVGVFFRGMEGNLTLDNPYFFPVYQTAMELDLPVCIHTGSGTPAVTAMFDLERNRQWSHSGFPTLHAFRDLVLNQIPDTFPKLRFGFIEASASWIPYLIHKLRRDNTKRWKVSWQSPVDLFDDCRFFVACEADEDIPYLIQYTSEGHLLTGSDYGHNDPAEQT